MIAMASGGRLTMGEVPVSLQNVANGCAVGYPVDSRRCGAPASLNAISPLVTAQPLGENNAPDPSKGLGECGSRRTNHTPHKPSTADRVYSTTSNEAWI
jgi:hypothetical protein